jgi:hypothetical protein
MHPEKFGGNIPFHFSALQWTESELQIQQESGVEEAEWRPHSVFLSNHLLSRLRTFIPPSISIFQLQTLAREDV